MQLKAKIKTMNPQSIRGTRLFPVQVLTADSSKSIQIPGDLTRSSYQEPTLVDQTLSQTLQSQSIRSITRHTTDFSANRPQVSRLSLDQAINNRVSIEDTSRQSSHRTHNTSFQNKSVSNTKQSNFESLNIARNSIQRDQNMFSNLKDLRIQRIQSVETAKMIEKLGESQIQSIRQFSLQKDSPSLKLFSKNSSLQNQNNSTLQSLYLSYKAKCDSLEADYSMLIQKFKNCQQYIDNLQRSKEEQILSASRIQNQAIANQNKTISKLEQSITKSRCINEMLMKKERDYQKKIKKIEEQQEQQWKKRAEVLKQQIWKEAKNKNEEVILNLEKINFQFKLKLIDQANHYQEQLEKANRTFQSLLLQKENQKKQILAQVNAERNQLDQALSFHIQESQNKSNIIGDLSFQISQKQNMLQRLSHQLNAYKDQLNAYTFDNNQLVQQIQETKRQKSRIVTSYIQQISQSKLSAFKLQNDVQSLAQTVEDKENAIAKLSKQKSTAQLQILELKNQIKIKSQQKDKDNLTIESLKRQILDINLQGNQLKAQLLAQKIEKQALNRSYNQQLQEAKVQINSLKNNLYAAEEQMELRLSQYQLKIYNLMRQLEDKTSQRDQVLQQLQNIKQQFQQKIMQNSEQMTDQISENLVFKMQILEELKENKQRIIFLENQCQKLKEQAKQLESLNSTLQEEKKSFQQAVTASRNKIIELTQALQQLRRQVSSEEEQRKIKEKQISQREEELKKVQSEYLELIEGELKKLYETEQQNINFNQKQSSFQLVNFFSQKKLQSKQNSPTKQLHQQKNQSFQNILEEDVEKLRQQVQQLTFVNDALKRKVEQLSQIQQSSNIIIMDRIKTFSEQIEAILEEKARTEQVNAQITLRLHQLTDKCIFYEGRIDWLDANYKALEVNLLETQQELMKSEFKYINYKIMSNKVQEQLQQESVQPQPIQIKRMPTQKDIACDQLLNNVINPDQIEIHEDQLICSQQKKSQKSEKSLDIQADVAQEIKIQEKLYEQEVKCEYEQFKEASQILEQHEGENSIKEEKDVLQAVPSIHIICVKSESEDDIEDKIQSLSEVKINIFTVLSQAEDQDHSYQQQKSDSIECIEDPFLIQDANNEIPECENKQVKSDQIDIPRQEENSKEAKPFDLFLDILNQNQASLFEENIDEQKRQSELNSQQNSLNADLSVEQLQKDEKNNFE